MNKKCGVTAITDSGNYKEGIIKPNRNPESHNHLPKPKGLEVYFLLYNKSKNEQINLGSTKVECFKGKTAK